MPYLIYLFILLFAPLCTHARVFFWKDGGHDSLSLINQKNAVSTNGVLKSTSNIGCVTTEDIVFESSDYISKLLVNMDKDKSQSYVVMKIHDTFTDNLILEKVFHERGSVSLSSTGAETGRVYIKLEIYGDDINVSSFGLSVVTGLISSPENFKINTKALNFQNRELELEFTLLQEAQVFLFVYNQNGDISEKIIDGLVFPIGTYKYHWTPKISGIFGETYYIWVRMENLRSEPVEFSEPVYVTP